MDSIGKIIYDLATKDNREPGDYIEDGYLMCGKCHTRKQFLATFPTGDGGTKEHLVPVACKCMQEQRAAEEAARKKREFSERMERLRRDGITDPAYLLYTFERDDRRNPKYSEVCKRYVENWAEMKADNIGILFYGSVGTGKSFFACAIANALLDRCVSTSVTNLPRILNRLQTLGEERQAFIDKLQRYQLLVIDDLGVERETSYAAEQVYNVIDTRARAGLPLIITTNLTMQELENPENMQYKRIYDRVLEMCPIRLKMTGESRRVGNAEERKAKAKQILGV